MKFYQKAIFSAAVVGKVAADALFAEPAPESHKAAASAKADCPPGWDVHFNRFNVCHWDGGGLEAAVDSYRRAVGTNTYWHII